MSQGNRIPVLLDQPLVQSMLNGLLQGAKRKVLKVVISADNNIYVESKELRMTLATGEGGNGLDSLSVQNEKQSSFISRAALQDMKLDKLGDDAVKELRDKYTPYSHNLADSLYVFSRQYGNS